MLEKFRRCGIDKSGHAVTKRVTQSQIQGGPKKWYPPTFLLTLAILFKLTQKFLCIMAAAGFVDNNNIKWTTQMKKFYFEKYFEVKSYKAISEDFMTHFPNHKSPYKSLVIYYVSKFRPFGTVEDFNRKIPDR